MNIQLLTASISVCLFSGTFSPYIKDYRSEIAKTIKTEDKKSLVEVTLVLEGQTVKGKPKIAFANNTFDALHEKTKNSINCYQQRIGENTWKVHLEPGKSYVIGWIAEENNMFGYCSEPFTAANRLRVTFSPGMPATFEYDLTKPPKDLKLFPVDVFLLKNIVLEGKETTLSWGGNKTITKPGVVKITGLAAGSYRVNAQTKNRSAGIAYLYNDKPIEIKSGIVNIMEPNYPHLDTTVEEGDMTISGKVVDVKGKPLAGKTVSISVHCSFKLSPQFLFYPQRKTDKNGNFRFIGVRPDIKSADIFAQNTSVHIGEESFRPNNSISVTVVVGLKEMPITKGQPFENIAIEWKDGSLSSISDLAGKIVIIDVWATWCGPCKKALPKFNDLAGEFSNRKDIVFIALNLDYDRANWENFTSESGYNNLKHGWFNQAKNIFQIHRGIPYYIIIDKNGTVYEEGNEIDIKAGLNKILEIQSDQK
jgi:thiol-disulfide isomerase/thioredoxin